MSPLGRIALASCLLICPIPGRTQTADPAAIAQQARAALASGEYDRAANLYRDLCRQVPSEPGLRLNLGIALYSGGKYLEAIAELERVLRQNPQIQPAYLFLGLSRLRAGKADAAIAPLTRALEAEPGNGVALLALGDAHLTTGNARAAADSFSKAAAKDPRSPKAWRGLGLSHAEVSREAFSKLPADSPEAMVLMARSRLAQNEPKAAFGLLKKALERNPELPGVHAALAETYRMSGHPEWSAAEDAQEKRVRRSPMGAYGEALSASTQSLDAFARLAELPESPELYETEADSARLRGAFQESADAMRKAAALRPGDRRVEEGLARSLWLNRNFDEAAPLLRKYGMDFELGYALLETGRAAEAIPLLERGARNPKLTAEASAALGRAYLEAGEPAKAIAPLKAGLASDRDGSVHFQLSRAYQRTGQPESARLMLERSSELRAQEEAVRERIRSQQITAP
jgi:tetratricopeptide (TPR) repeat protein